MVSVCFFIFNCANTTDIFFICFALFLTNRWIRSFKCFWDMWLRRVYSVANLISSSTPVQRATRTEDKQKCQQHNPQENGFPIFSPFFFFFFNFSLQRSKIFLHASLPFAAWWRRLLPGNRHNNDTGALPRLLLLLLSRRSWVLHPFLNNVKWLLFQVQHDFFKEGEVVPGLFRTSDLSFLFI